MEVHSRWGDSLSPFSAQYTLAEYIGRLKIEKTSFVKYPCDIYKYYPYISQHKNNFSKSQSQKSIKQQKKVFALSRAQLNVFFFQRGFSEFHAIWTWLHIWNPTGIVFIQRGLHGFSMDLHPVLHL